MNSSPKTQQSSPLAPFSPITELHIEEQYSIARTVQRFFVRDSSGNLLVSLEVEANSSDIETITRALRWLDANGVTPDRVYIGVWSQCREAINEVWPQARVFLEYND